MSENDRELWLCLKLAALADIGKKILLGLIFFLKSNLQKPIQWRALWELGLKSVRSERCWMGSGHQIGWHPRSHQQKWERDWQKWRKAGLNRLASTSNCGWNYITKYYICPPSLKFSRWVEMGLNVSLPRSRYLLDQLTFLRFLSVQQPFMFKSVPYLLTYIARGMVGTTYKGRQERGKKWF